MDPRKWNKSLSQIQTARTQMERGSVSDVKMIFSLATSAQPRIQHVNYLKSRDKHSSRKHDLDNEHALKIQSYQERKLQPDPKQSESATFLFCTTEHYATAK